MIQLISPDEKMVEHVIADMREIDIAEIMETSQAQTIESMKKELQASVNNVVGIKYCLTINGDPVCLGGVHDIAVEVGQAWFFATKRIERAGISLTKQTKRVIRYCLDSRYRRIQADSAAFHTEAHRWLGVCGFNLESVKKNYGKSCDFNHYVIFR